MTDASGHLAVGCGEAAQRLTDDLELAFDSPAKLTIGFIVRERAPLAPAKDAASRLQYVKQQLLRPVVHR